MKLFAIAALFAAGSAAADQGMPVTFGGMSIAGEVLPLNEQGVPQWVNPNPDATALKQWWKEQVAKSQQPQPPAAAAPRPAVPSPAASPAPVPAVQSGCRPELRALNLCHVQVPARAPVAPSPMPVAAPVAPLPVVVTAPAPTPQLVPQPSVPAATVVPPTRLDPALSRPAVVTEVKPSGPPAWETPPQGRNPFEEVPSSVLFEVKR